jgi:hypothetical protein
MHDTEHKTRTAKLQYRLPFGPEAHCVGRRYLRCLTISSPGTWAA